MDKKDLVLEYYLGEYNCAQSIVLSFQKEMGMTKEDLAKISLGFGGGIGGTQNICGALTGGVIVLGALCKNDVKDSIKKMINEFEMKNKYIECANILQLDFNNELTEKEKEIKKEKCIKCVQDVVGIVEKLI
jgi:C_GCAxxG_C_C family probable redox protein